MLSAFSVRGAFANQKLRIAKQEVSKVISVERERLDIDPKREFCKIITDNDTDDRALHYV